MRTETTDTFESMAKLNNLEKSLPHVSAPHGTIVSASVVFFPGTNQL